MLIALILVTKAAPARLAPCMLLGRLQMAVQLCTRLKSCKACQTDKFVSDTVVVLEMILETPLVLERRKTQVAVRLVTERVVDMILQAVSVFEYALA